MKQLLFLLSFLCLSAAAQEEMFYRDTTRVGVPFAKDPMVVRFQGRYLMYYSIPPYVNKNDVGWNIGIAESHDLSEWTKVGEITPAPGLEYEARGLCAPGALVRGDTLHLFYQTYGNREKDAICHAFTTDGLHFTRNATNPIFHPTGKWTCGRAIDAEVCEFRGKYFLYYASRDPLFERQIIGVATAPLGTNFNREAWTEVVDSAILQPELPWEKKCIEGASVIRRGKKLYMFYAGAYNNEPQQIGVASSTDGIRWERLSDEPFLRNGAPGSWNESESGHPCIFRDKKGKTFLFFQGNNTHGRNWIISKMRVKWKKRKPTT